VRLLLLDSASLYWRAYHALPDSIVDDQGRPVNAVRGFLDTVARIIDSEHPDRTVACWDVDWRPAWRVDLVPSYKAHRVQPEPIAADSTGEPESTDPASVVEAVPDTLSPQVPMIQRILELTGIPIVGAAGWEADDVIATLALQAATRGDEVLIASGDRDLVQLASDRITVLYTGGTSRSRGGKPWLRLDPIAVAEQFGVRPQDYATVAVLRGDPSDGIPGVPGIGEKTAVALVHAFGTLDGILAAAGETPMPPMTPRIAAALVTHAEPAERAYRITKLIERPEIPRDIPTLHADPEAALREARELNVVASMRRLLAAWGITAGTSIG
jgi:5'-3' exonuclease